MEKVNRPSLNHLEKYHRIHMSDMLLPEIYIEGYVNTTTTIKPTGLYYSIGTEWLEWVKEEMPEWEQEYIYSIELNEDYILKIDTLQELMDFCDKYKNTKKDRLYSEINWNKVAKDYSGIELNNYRKIKYTDLNVPVWYHCFDVSSGCIWRKNALKSFQKINEIA